MGWNFQEYKDKKEAQKFFRQNNDQFLSSEQWMKTIGAGAVGAIIMGIVHGAITMKVGIDFSIFYIIIGYAVANIVTSVSQVSSKQVAIASVVCTFISFYFSNVTMIYLLQSMFGVSLLDMGTILVYGLRAMLSGDILDWIFIIVGLFVAYQQAQ